MRILVGLINGMIAGATPILLAALGGAFTYYAGIFNIAMEGMMLAGAFGAVVGSYFLHSWVLGIVLSIAFALVLALIFIGLTPYVAGAGLLLDRTWRFSAEVSLEK